MIGLAFSLLVAAPRAALEAYRPSEQELRAHYADADALRAKLQGKVTMANLTPHWIDATSMWFLFEYPGGQQFLTVGADDRKKRPLFDHEKLARAIHDVAHHDAEPLHLPLTDLNVASDHASMTFVFMGDRYHVDFASYAVRKVESNVEPAPQTPPGPRQRPNRRPRRADSDSPDGKWTARIVKQNIVLTPKGGGDPITLSDSGTETTPFERFEWAPDGKHLVGVRLIPGDRKTVTIIQSSPPGGGRAVVKTRPYELPGDKLDVHEMWLFDVEARKGRKVDADPVEIDFDVSIHWKSDGSTFTYEKTDRGNTRFRLYEVQATTGAVSTLIDHQPSTFIDQTTKWLHYLKNDDVLWRSEKDGWGRLYYVSRASRDVKPITTGDWVVRGVDEVDEDRRRIVFHASGVHPGEDPYFNHTFRVNFDGTGLTELTPAAGNHTVQISPDKKLLVDTYSTVTQPPIHELRDAETGAFVAKLAEADVTGLKKIDWKAPEVFVAKGRDGVTDIWGVVYRPSYFDPHKTYPIVENIYAGPQDSFVPKAFAAYNYMQSVAELGFIVVQCDGMGTRNRSKAFHDVCWKNLADAGFPDRILWMKALAKKYPQFDATRVGIFGTSAGGQNSTGAVLFHPEFYKVAVSSCGCHDNRMDKYWWNEQWMGFPVGKHYEEQSNITNAAKLQGDLLLMVGEMDTNVPPESTYRLVDALIKAGKDFEFVVLPGLDHTSGGSFGERKRRDFFVKHLLGVDPPRRNGVVTK